MKGRLAAAVACALLGGALLYLYLRRFEQEATGGAPTIVLVARKPLEPGAVLDESMLTKRSVPRAYVETRSVRDTDLARVLGLRVSGPVQAQQTLLWTDLAVTADDRRDLSSLVQPGMRAFSVRAQQDDRSFLLVRPGDRVDVLSVSVQHDQPSASYLLQNILVLAVGLDTGAVAAGATKRAEAPRGDAVLTLSVNQQEAQLLAVAKERGRLTVAVRNPDDVRVSDKLAEVKLDAPSNAPKLLNGRPSGSADGPVRLEGRR